MYFYARLRPNLNVLVGTCYAIPIAVDEGFNLVGYIHPAFEKTVGGVEVGKKLVGAQLADAKELPCDLQILGFEGDRRYTYPVRTLLTVSDRVNPFYLHLKFSDLQAEFSISSFDTATSANREKLVLTPRDASRVSVVD